MKSSWLHSGFRRLSTTLLNYLAFSGAIALLGAIAITVVLLAARKHQLYKEEIINEFRRSHVRTAENISLAIGNGIEEIADDLEGMGGLISSGQEDTPYSRFWRIYDDRNGGLLSFTVADSSGIIISDHPDSVRSFQSSHAQGKALLTQLDNRRISISSLKNASIDTTLKTLEIYVPIAGSDQNRTFITAEINLDHLWSRAFRYDTADGIGAVCIWDDRGNILYHSDSNLNSKNIAQFNEICGDEKPDICENTYCFDRETIMMSLSRLKEGNSEYFINENIRDLVVFYPVKIYGSIFGVAYKSSKSQIMGPINADIRLTIIVVLGLFFLSALMVLVLAKNSRTRYRLREETKRADDMLDSARSNESIVASIPSPLAVLDNDLKVASVNRSFSRTFLVSRDLAVGKSLCEILNCRRIPACKPKNEPDANNSPPCQLKIMLSKKIDVLHNQSSAFEIEIDRIHAGRETHSMLKVEIGDIESEYKGLPHQILVSILDITDQHKAESALKASEERYRSLYQNTPVMMHSIDSEGRIVNVNNKWLEVMGYDRSEVLNRRSIDFLTEESKKVAVEEILPDFFRTGYCYDVRYQFVKKNGETMEVLLSAECERDGQGNIDRSLAVIIDITERNRFERALIDNEKFNRAIIENSPIGISVRSRTGRLLSSNQAWKVIWNKTEDDVKRLMSEQKTSLNFDNRDDYLGLYKEEVKKVYEQGGYCFIPELKLINDRGDGPHWISQHFYAIKDDSGKVEKVVILTADITEQKRTEGALKQSEEKFRLISEQNLMGIAVIRNDRFEYFNDIYSQLLGFSRDELSGIQVDDIVHLIHPDDMALVREQYRKKISGESDYITRYAYRIITPQGDLKWIEQFSKPIQMEDGLADLVTIIDITDRIKAENELKLTKFGVDHTAIVVLRISPDGKISYANEFACKFLGFPHDQLIGKSLTELDVHFDSNEWDTHWRRLKQKGDLLYESYFRTKPNEEIPVGIQMSHFKFNNNEFGYLFAYDFSDRKKTEESLRRLGTAVEQSAEAIVIADKNGIIQYVNPAFETITGYSRKEAIGQNPKLLKSGIHNDEFYRHMWETILRGETWRGKVTNKNKAGVLYEEEMSISPVKDECGNIVNFVAVKRDVSRQTALESQLRQSQKLEAIGRLAGGVAHDFNNLLTAINGYSEFVLESIDKDSPLRSDVEEIRKAGERAASLTNQLLAFGRRQIQQPKPLNINDIVMDMDKMLRRIIGEDIEFITLLSPELSLVNADQSHMEQIVMNLVINSRDAMPGGGKLIIETNNIRADEAFISGHVGMKAGNYVQLTVSDSGVGMTKEIQGHIFEPFFTTKEIGRGTGLGLSTVYGIIQQSNGHILLSSEPGSGTTFKIYLPRTTQCEPVQDEINHDPAGSGGGETILLVEDDDVVRNLAYQILTRDGFKVLQTSNSYEAPYICKNLSGKIDLLLTDVVMPILNGPRLYQQLKEFNSNLRVLYMSGYTNDSLAAQGLMGSEADFIQKPFKASQLVQKIRELLDKTPATKGNRQSQMF